MRQAAGGPGNGDGEAAHGGGAASRESKLAGSRSAGWGQEGVYAAWQTRRAQIDAAGESVLGSDSDGARATGTLSEAHTVRRG